MEDQKNKMSKGKSNPLVNEKIFVRFVPNGANRISDKNHVLYGGLAEGAIIRLCVPQIESTGAYKNVLTNDEKDFLEEHLGMDSNSLSVYKKTNNYWDNYTVELTKDGLHLDLSDAEDFIKYKVLLANTSVVAPSVKELQSKPKATYRFVLERESEANVLENAKMNATMRCYKEFGKIEDDADTMRVLVELSDAKPYATNTPIDSLRSRINVLIQSNPNAFLSRITDPMLHSKVLISRGVELGVLARRGDHYYLASDNSPLCGNNEEPTMPIAAKFISIPANQQVKFALEDALSKARSGK